MSRISPHIFFLCNDPERALGLENVLKNYHILCIDDNPIIDQIKKAGGKVFCLERAVKKSNPIFRSSSRLLMHPKTQEYITQHTPTGVVPKIMLFKPDTRAEKIIKKRRFKSLNPSVKLNRSYEYKIAQYSFFKKLKLPHPQMKTMSLEETTFGQLKKRYGLPFIMQYNRGHTGNSTILIKNKNTFLQEKKVYPKRMTRFSKFISGEPWTINACATRFGTVYGGLCYQITGDPICTANPMATIGNDWTRVNQLNKKVLKQIKKITRKVGYTLYQSSYKGLFGLDFVIDKQEQQAYIIEINARQPASIPMHNYLMQEQQLIPLSAWHLAEYLFSTDKTFISFLNKHFSFKLSLKNIKKRLRVHNRQATQPIQAAQIFIRNTSNQPLKLSQSISPGVYNELVEWQRPGYNINDLKTTTERMILAVSANHKINPEMEVARIQSPTTLLDREGRLLSKTKRTITNIKSQLDI